MGGNSNNKPAAPKPLRQHSSRIANIQQGRSVVILGPTGATGKFILSYFIRSPEWTKITIIHRRLVDLDEISKKSKIAFTEQQKSKVTQHEVDMEKLGENGQNVELFKDHEFAICVLGTTRATAKSAENFRKVDLYMVRDGAILSKKAGIKHFSLLTSKGSNSNVWANDWKISHGLLYLKVKGDAEQACIQQKFQRLSIFRPGGLARDGNKNFMLSLDVRDLAAVMVYDLESDDISDDKVEKTVFYESGDIDGLVEIAQDNFNKVCVGDKKENDVEAKDVNDQKDEIKEEKKEEIKEEKKEEVQSDDVVVKEANDVGVGDDNGITPKYEVVEKPEDGNIDNQEYVQVDKADADKQEDGNQ